MSSFGTRDLSKVFAGTNKVDKIFAGDSLVYSEQGPGPQPTKKGYLTFWSESTIALQTYKYDATPDAAYGWDGLMEYSFDTYNWYDWYGEPIINDSYMDSDYHYCIHLRGTNNTYITGGNSGGSTYRFSFENSAYDVHCDGYLDCLLDYRTVLRDEWPTMADYAFYYLFARSTRLVTPPKMLNPNLSPYCYMSIFRTTTAIGSAIENIPALPATYVPANAYTTMFNYQRTLSGLLSYTQDSTYYYPFRMPVNGNGSADTSATIFASGMFTNTNIGISDTPQINTTYYSKKLPVGGEELTLIKEFTIDSSNYSCEYTMNWQQFIDSEYNTDGFYSLNNYVYNYNGDPICDYSMVQVSANSIIWGGANYSILQIRTFYINNISYQFAVGLTFEQWVTSQYNTAGFTYDSDGFIWLNNQVVSYNGAAVSRYDTIVENRFYVLDTVKEFIIESELYEFISGQSFYDWVYSSYNIDGYKISNGKVLNSTGDKVVAYNNVDVSSSTIIVQNQYYELKDLPPNFITFKGNDTFTLSFSNTSYQGWDGTLQYSTDKVNWNNLSSTSSVSCNSTTYELYLRGIGNTRVTYNSTGGVSYFVLSGNATWIDCIGNIETLLDYQTVESGNHPTYNAHAFDQAFYSCTLLRTAPDLLMTTGKGDAFVSMFYGCTNLVNPPIIKLASSTSSASTSNIYRQMFYGCTSLNKLPILLLDHFGSSACYRMFYNCRNIAIAETQTDTYLYPYRIPFQLDVTGTESTAFINMFANTGGTVTGTPTINKLYYTKNELVGTDGIDVLKEFIISDTTYRANYNATWYDFVNSVYSQNNFRISGNEAQIYANGQYWPIINSNNTRQTANDFIYGGTSYRAEIIKTMTIDGTSYQFVDGMTWSEWVSSSYNINSKFYVDISFVKDSQTDYSVGYNNQAVQITDIVDTLNYSLLQQTAGSIKCDLSSTYATTYSTSQVVFQDGILTATINKGSSQTNANNYINGYSSRTSTRIYKNQQFIISLPSNYIITKIDFMGASSSYATTLNTLLGNTSGVTSVSKSGSLVTANISSGSSITLNPTATAGMSYIEVYYVG